MILRYLQGADICGIPSGWILDFWCIQCSRHLGASHKEVEISDRVAYETDVGAPSKVLLVWALLVSAARGSDVDIFPGVEGLISYGWDNCIPLNIT